MLMTFLVHAHSGSSGTCRHRRLGLLDVCYYRLCSKKCGSNGVSVLKSTSCNLNRIKDSGLDHINIPFLVCIKALANL